MPEVICIAGWSGSGKTTLLEKLLPEIRRRGYQVGTVKHNAHGFDLDHEGKDSWRHKRAGASAVVMSGPSRVALIRDVERELTLDEIVAYYLKDMDAVLAEGYKREDKPKIEVFRKDGPHKEMLCRGDKNLIALVTDEEMTIGVPCFGLEETEQLADFLERHFSLGKHP